MDTVYFIFLFTITKVLDCYLWEKYARTKRKKEKLLSLLCCWYVGHKFMKGRMEG